MAAAHRLYTLEAIYGFVTVRSWISGEISTRSKVIVAHEKQRRWINVPCPTAPPYKLFNTGHLKTGWSRPNKNGVETVENFFNDYKLATTLQVGFTLFTMTKPFLARLLVESFFPREFSLLSPIQTDATLLANNSNHCWMLHVASVSTPCCMLLPLGGSLKPAKLLATCKRTQQLQTMLGVYIGQLLRPFAL